jgi:hypothetical protein
MRTEYEITERINAILENVDTLSKKRDEEMEKPFEKRDHRLLYFINRECNVYSYSLSQLTWLFSEQQS